jgi:PAS domain S-box-containing protein
VRNLADEVQLLVFTVQDITERKAAEGALQLSEEKFAKAFVSNPSAICLTGMADSRVVDANPAFTRIFGFPREEYTGRTILQLGLWPTPEDREAAVGELQREGFFRNRQQKMRTKYGEERDFLASAEAISIGDEPMIVSTWLDITDLKRTENELRESEQRFRLALKNAPVTVAAQDPDLRYIWAYNQRTARPEDIIDSFDRDIFTPEEAAHITAIKQRVLQENIELREQMWFNRPHGRIFLDVCWEPIHDPAGKVTGVASATVDLTPLKLAEEALQASLAEKEVLLKEVHHRVKNNMQVISSLVDLQADEVKDEAMRTIFQDLIYRVRAMAMVHEKLYKSVELAQVDFADYAQSLLRYLWQAQGALTSGIELNLHLKPVLLSVNASIPFGLILNEVFTNALKHAFKGRDRGAIVVSLGQEEGRLVHLEVGDDGIGLPPDLDWQNSRSLGLRLVNTLARQLHAETEITSAQGTRFALRFEKHERN